MLKPKFTTLVKVALAVLACGAGGLFLAVWWFQAHGIYRFDPRRLQPSDVGLPGVRVVRFRAEDGVEVAAWVAAPRGARPLLISFFGGHACVGDAAARLRPLLDEGFGLAMLVYRGSSGEGGVPSEAAFAMDARALYDQLDALLGGLVPVERRVLHGFSLGGSVAAGLAAERDAAGLVLEGTLDRCCRWYSVRFGGLPMCWLMWRERHDVIDKLAGVAMQKLFLHGALDDTVPIAWARALHDSATGEKRFITYERGRHADLAEHGALRDLAAFMASLPARGR